MPIKSFRAKIADNTTDTIVLHTNDGSTGYKITKFEIMGIDGNTNIEGVMKIYSIPQTTETTDIDFSDNTLLAAAIIKNTTSASILLFPTVIFDNMIFNQDIYVTFKCHDNSAPANYHLELETMKLDLSENTVATLKDIRNIEAQ
tara:strand:+ start:1442 stop:1876 length:435 start_codon:yes stop_codon:yes gene_type:complete